LIIERAKIIEFAKRLGALMKLEELKREMLKVDIRQKAADGFGVLRGPSGRNPKTSRRGQREKERKEIGRRGLREGGSRVDV
jgi:hypothetical protein